MNESINKPILLKCPKCGHSWNYKGKQKRASCPRCQYRRKEIVWIKTGITPSTPPTTPPNTSSIQDGIASGYIICIS